jgi:hypothetical protein
MGYCQKFRPTSYADMLDDRNTLWKNVFAEQGSPDDGIDKVRPKSSGLLLDHLEVGSEV